MATAGAPRPHTQYEPPPSWLTSAEGALEMRDVFGVLRRNAWLIVLSTVLITAGVWYVVSRQVPLYRASAAIRLVDAQRQLAGGISDASLLRGSGINRVLSQIEILRGRDVVGKVVDREGLQLVGVQPGGEPVGIRDVQITGPEPVGDTIRLTFEVDGANGRNSNGVSGSAAYGAPLRIGGLEFTVPARPAIAEAALVVVDRDVAIDNVIGALSAQPRQATDAVDVQFVSADPTLARRVVNASIDVFRDVSATTAQTESRRRRQFLERQLVSVDSSLDVLNQRLNAFRSQHQVYNSQEKMAAQASSVTELDVQRADMGAERQMLSVLLAELQRVRGSQQQFLHVLATSPVAHTNSAVSRLHSSLQDAVATRDSLTSGPLAITAQHPTVQRLDMRIAQTREEILGVGRNQLALLDARVRALDQLRARYSGTVEALSAAGAEEDQLQQQLATMKAMGDQLRTELQRARIAEAVEVGQVEIINYAPLPRQPIGSGDDWKIGLGLVLGLMLGSGLAFARESLDRTIHSKEELERVLRLPGLALIPPLGGTRPKRSRWLRKRVLAAESGADRSGGTQLVSLLDAEAPAAEAFRLLRTSLLYSQTAHALKTIVVTSATPGEGKTTTAANLAVSFAEQGMRVLLIECDLRRPRLHRIFGLNAEPGLTDLLLGFASPTDAVHQTDVEGLSLITCGKRPPNPSELLGGPRMERALRMLTQGFDLILLDTPPLMAVADAVVLGMRTDGVVLVVRAGRTERAAARQAIQQLQAVGARILGTVLNDPDAQALDYGTRYSYYSGYSAGRADAE